MASKAIARQIAACHGHHSGARKKAIRTPGSVPTVPEATGLKPVPNPLATKVVSFFMRERLKVQCSRFKVEGTRKKA
jgi:hypothetical protein